MIYIIIIFVAIIFWAILSVAFSFIGEAAVKIKENIKNNLNKGEEKE